jgi:Rod binding domain-containing protein
MQINTINTNITSANQVEKQQGLTNEEKMQKAAKEFESFFVYQMLQETQPAVDLNSDFMGGEVEQTFRPILNQYLAEEITEAGGIGLQENIINQMKKYQEVDGYGR